MDIVANRNKLSLTECYYGAADTEALAKRMGAIVNFIITYIDNTPPVGSIHQSSLSEAAFQAKKGVGWVLMDGRNVAGSAYDALFGPLIPDGRDLFLRGKNFARSSATGDPTGNHTTGFTGLSTLKSHNHAGQFSGLNPWPVAWTTGYPVLILDTDGGDERFYANPALMTVSISLGATPFPLLSQGVVGANSFDNDPMCVAANFFIRIN